MNDNRNELFETMPVGKALFTMAVPTIISQLIILVYNMTDMWFIGRTNNAYMVGAASMVATVLLMIQTLATIFGTGGGNETVIQLGRNDETEARKVASLSFLMAAVSSLLSSILCWFTMNPMLYFLGASENTILFARQYMLIVVVLGGVPIVIANTMSFMLRNIGYSREAAMGLTIGSILNIVLDPIFMFIILPSGYEVMGAALATLIANIISLLYFIVIYCKVRNHSVLDFPRRIEKVRWDSLKSIFVVGLPAGLAMLFYDLTNMMLNRLSASHGDFSLAAMGIVLKVERLPLNIGIGICLGMTPLIAYNFASGNKKRMKEFFVTARRVGMVVALISVAIYLLFTTQIISLFINEPNTIEIGTKILKVRALATPFMFLSFHMVHLMQALKKGGIAFLLAFIRQLCLNIPILILLNHLFGMNGIVCSQVIADIINVTISYLIYYKVVDFARKESVR